ncbi:MAG: RNA methyltransferase, partial [Anaerolineales bacterium]|nr:RNA methyltransferase [Anaerolineales bacterium]
ITSTHNPKIQWARALQSKARQRREESAYVVEGVRLVEEAYLAGRQPLLVLHSAELDERGQELVAGFAQRGCPVEPVAEHVLRAASDTQTPQGILAVLPWENLPAPEKPDFVLIPDGVRDPGNLGSMLRAAAAAGVDVAWLPPGTVDAYAPKVVRAAMGAHFHLPLRQAGWEEITHMARRARLKLYLADAQGGEAYTDVDLRIPLALVVGGEAEGASLAALQAVDARVHISMPGKSESLNAAAAAAILLFEVVRQRCA